MTTKAANKRILIAEDEPDVLNLVALNLKNAGYNVLKAEDGVKALAMARDTLPSLIILDLMLPEMSGLDVCKVLKKDGGTSAIPIIMLTAKAEEIDKVLGLELGADDYITKPFSMHEFRSRVKAALRRAGMTRANEEPNGEAAIETGDLRIEPSKRTVAIRGERVDLTFVEFEILVALSGNPGRVFTREALLTRIWGDSAYRDPRTIDVHIRHLREKIEVDPKEPEYLFTVRGVGYRFRDVEE